MYVVADYENCSTGIGFADAAFSLKGNVFNFRKEYGKMNTLIWWIYMDVYCI